MTSRPGDHQNRNSSSLHGNAGGNARSTADKGHGGSHSGGAGSKNIHTPEGQVNTIRTVQTEMSKQASGSIHVGVAIVGPHFRSIKLMGEDEFKTKVEQGQVAGLHGQARTNVLEKEECVRLENRMRSREQLFRSGFKQVIDGGVQQFEGFNLAACLDDPYKKALLGSDVDMMVAHAPQSLREEAARLVAEDEEGMFVPAKRGKQAARGGAGVPSSPSPIQESVEDRVTKALTTICEEQAKWPLAKKAREVCKDEACMQRVEEGIAMRLSLINTDDQDKLSALKQRLAVWEHTVQGAYVQSVGAVHTALQRALGQEFQAHLRDRDVIASVPVPADYTSKDPSEIRKFKEVTHLLHLLSTSYNANSVSHLLNARQAWLKSLPEYKPSGDVQKYLNASAGPRASYYDLLETAKDQRSVTALLDVLAGIPRSPHNSALYNLHLEYDSLAISEVNATHVVELSKKLQLIHESLKRGPNERGSGPASNGQKTTEKGQGQTVNKVDPGTQRGQGAHSAGKGGQKGGQGARDGGQKGSQGGKGASKAGKDGRQPGKEGGEFEGLCYLCQGPGHKMDKCPDLPAMLERERALRSAEVHDMTGVNAVFSRTIGADCDSSVADDESDAGSGDADSELGDDASAMESAVLAIGNLAAVVQDLQVEVSTLTAAVAAGSAPHAAPRGAANGAPRETFAAATSTSQDRSPTPGRGGDRPDGGALKSALCPKPSELDSGTTKNIGNCAMNDVVKHHEVLRGFNGNATVSTHRGTVVRGMVCARTGAVRWAKYDMWHCKDVQKELISVRTFVRCGHTVIMGPEGSRVVFKDGQEIWLKDETTILWSDAAPPPSATGVHAAASAAPAAEPAGAKAKPRKSKSNQQSKHRPNGRSKNGQ